VATWDEDRTYILSVIRTNAGADAGHDPVARAAEGERNRQALEARLEGQLRPGARVQFRKLARSAQHYARSRERSKGAWARSIRLSRRPVLEMGRRCASRGLIADSTDIGFLLLDEVEAIFTGKGRADYRGVVAARKKEHERMKTLVPPELYTAPPEVVPIAAAEKQTGKTLTGAGVSVGVASGRARIISSAAAAEDTDLVAGEVLVAPFTDAAWTPMFMSAAAVVVETGGMLSHAATVAREYGIPAVVAVKGATSLIQDGQMLTVDGTAGTVTLGS
jgi:pyruvate,water dikinase